MPKASKAAVAPPADSSAPRLPLVAAAVSVAAVAAAAVWLGGAAPSATVGSAAGHQLECGPITTEHLSELPAHGLHVLRAVDGSPCSGGASSFRAYVYVDGSPAGPTAASGWTAGQIISVDTEDGVEKDVAVLGQASSGDAAQRKVRFVDGVVDDWDASDFKAQVGADGAPVLELPCPQPGAAAEETETADRWVFGKLRQLVEYERPRLLARLRVSGALTLSGWSELSEPPSTTPPGGTALSTPTNKWKVFSPYGSPVPTDPPGIVHALQE